MNASETFAVGGEQFTVPIQIDLGGPTFTLTAADMANPTPVFAAIPSGTAAAPVTVRLPAGEFITDVTCEVNDKSWWRLGPPPGERTILRFPTYGPVTGSSPVGPTYGRRHFRINRCFDSTISGIKVWGPHTPRFPGDPTRALSTIADPTMARYEFQHAFTIGYSNRLTLTDMEGYEVGGDGIYLVDSYDITTRRLRVEFNGRQGLAGIGGTGWLFDDVEIVNAGRFANDFEPIGNFDSTGLPRWVRQTEICNSYLKGGIILNRVADIKIRANDILRGGVIVTPGSTPAGITDLSQNRSGIEIVDNNWPVPWTSVTANAGPIRASHLNGLTVSGNTITRDPLHTPTANASFVEVLDLPVTGHFKVCPNNLTNFASKFRFRAGLTQPPGVTTEVC